MNGPEAVVNVLDSLLARAEDDIHELELPDADLLENSAWYSSCRPERKKLLEKTAEALLHRSPRTHGPHLRQMEITGEKSAKQAQAMANTPLFVLVENRESDGALVKSAIRVFATPAAIELCLGAGALATPKAFDIDSGGGAGELPKVLAQRLQDAVDRQCPPRVIVIADTDGEWVGDIKDHAARIRTEAHKGGVPCPPLNKRTAENYIPDGVWRAWATDNAAARPAVEALLSLSPIQRDHVHIEGSNVDPWNYTKPHAASLFADVRAGDFDLIKAASLKGRRSSAIANMFETYKSEMTVAELKSRDSAGDLEAIVCCIEDEL